MIEIKNDFAYNNDEQIVDAFGRDIGYEVEGKFTRSKIRALELANGDISKINYRWQENCMDQLLWEIEPQEDLNSMVDRYVKKIRDSYSTVSLSFSGGYDSYTIFRAFARNNLVIDEFIIWERDWATGSLVQDSNEALAMAKLIKKDLWPNLKINLIRWGDSQSIYDYYLKHERDWIYHSGEVLRFSKHSRDFLWQHNYDVKKLMDRGPSCIYINGLDKPRLDIYDDKWWACRTDRSMYSEMGDWCLQFWFIPEIYLKQTWMMIRWMESNQRATNKYVHQLQSFDVPESHYRDWNLAIGRDLPPTKFCQGYGEKHVWSGTHNCIESKPLLDHARLTDKRLVDLYSAGIDYIKTKFDSVTMPDGRLPALFSKKYFVKNVTLPHD
jgi:hypothetical protein